MADIEQLRQELNDDPLGRGYSGMTDQQAADDLNTVYRQRTVPIPVSDIRRYLFVQNLWLSIKQGTQVSAVMARDALNMFERFHVDQQDVSDTVENLLDNLVSDGFITTDNKSTVLAMGVQSMTRAEELGLLGRSPEIGPAHVTQARNL